MSFKVLITCPPMLNQINSFTDIFDNLDMEITTPNIVQTLSEDELISIVPKHDAWIIGDDPATFSVFEAGKKGNLKAAVKWGIGTDNVDFEACKEFNIPITNTPGMFGKEVADLAMCYILGLARNAFYIDRQVRKGMWPKPSGISLYEKKLGIVGLGDIGINIAKRAYAHDLEVIGWDPFAQNIPDYISNKKYFPNDIKLCDFIVFACALNDDNHHMFNEKTLCDLKPGVRIINVSRGPLIKESALLEGLKNKIIHSAALDVFETEPLDIENDIIKYPNCILGSHNASNTVDAVNRASFAAIEIIEKMLKS